MDLENTKTCLFIKITDDGDKTNFPCIQCKKMCSGYWCVVKYSGVRRLYPFCQTCLETGLDKPDVKSKG